MAKFNEPLDPSDAETVIGEGVTSTSPARPSRSKTGLPDNLPRLGARFGGDDGARFELVEMLGRGGMGTVFLARDRLLERPVAVKFIIHPEYYLPQDERVALFKQEARATARLNHEGIVRVFDLGTYLRMPFLVMEYLEGQALSSIMTHQRLDALRATRIMADVARGLAHAHRTGIVHRDLKPSNIFIVKDSRAKILDFGLATVVRGPGSTQRSAQAHVSVVAGTPRYMSPEQWRGEPQDGRTDLWALGMIFFELLTGRTPVESKKIAAIRDGTISDRPFPSVRQLRPDLPLEADALVSRALSKDVAERFVTADEFLDAIVGLEVVLSRILRTSSQATTGEASRAVITQRQVSLVSFGLSNLATLSAELESRKRFGDSGELLRYRPYRRTTARRDVGVFGRRPHAGLLRISGRSRRQRAASCSRGVPRLRSGPGTSETLQREPGFEDRRSYRDRVGGRRTRQRGTAGSSRRGARTDVLDRTTGTSWADPHLCDHGGEHELAARAREPGPAHARGQCTLDRDLPRRRADTCDESLRPVSESRSHANGRTRA